MRRAALLLVMTWLAACSGGSEATQTSSTTSSTTSTTIATTTTSSSTTTTTTTEPTTTTTTEPQFALPDDPLTKVGIVQLDPSYFGSGYAAGDDSDDDGPLCEGIDALASTFPPLERDELTIEGDHLFFSNVSVYPSADDAIAAFDYLESAYQDCDERTRTVDGVEILLNAIEFSPPAILGADRLAGLALQQTSPDLSLLVQTRLIAVDDLLFFVGGTDAQVVQQMAQVVVGRTRMPAEPETFTPSGSAAIGPGYQDPFYYSYDAGPDELRSLDLNDGPTRWFAETSDERIDEVASNSCVATQELNPGDTAEVVDGVLLGVFSPDDLAAYAPEELAEIYSAANLVYCPGLQEYLLEVIDAIPE